MLSKRRPLRLGSKTAGRRGYLGTSEGSGLGMIGALGQGCVSAVVPASVQGTGAAEYKEKNTQRYLSIYAEGQDMCPQDGLSTCQGAGSYLNFPLPSRKGKTGLNEYPQAGLWQDWPLVHWPQERHTPGPGLKCSMCPKFVLWVFQKQFRQQWSLDCSG